MKYPPCQETHLHARPHATLHSNIRINPDNSRLIPINPYQQPRASKKFFVQAPSFSAGEKPQSPLTRLKNTPLLSEKRVLFLSRAGLSLALALLAVAVAGSRTELLFDAEKLVVLGHTVGAAGGTGLDLAGVRGNGDVSDRSIFRFARAVRDNGRVVVSRWKL